MEMFGMKHALFDWIILQVLTEQNYSGGRVAQFVQVDINFKRSKINKGKMY